jgi:hypothetical protein
MFLNRIPQCCYSPVYIYVQQSINVLLKLPNGNKKGRET